LSRALRPAPADSSGGAHSGNPGRQDRPPADRGVAASGTNVTPARKTVFPIFCREFNLDGSRIKANTSRQRPSGRPSLPRSPFFHLLTPPHIKATRRSLSVEVITFIFTNTRNIFYISCPVSGIRIAWIIFSRI